MKIGRYVQQHINQIFDKCDDSELNSLLGLEYSREALNKHQFMAPHFSKAVRGGLSSESGLKQRFLFQITGVPGDFLLSGRTTPLMPVTLA